MTAGVSETIRSGRAASVTCVPSSSVSVTGNAGAGVGVGASDGADVAGGAVTGGAAVGAGVAGAWVAPEAEHAATAAVEGEDGERAEEDVDARASGTGCHGETSCRGTGERGARDAGAAGGQEVVYTVAYPSCAKVRTSPRDRRPDCGPKASP